MQLFDNPPVAPKVPRDGMWFELADFAAMKLGKGLVPPPVLGVMSVRPEECPKGFIRCVVGVYYAVTKGKRAGFANWRAPVWQEVFYANKDEFDAWVAAQSDETKARWEREHAEVKAYYEARKEK